MTYHPKDDPTDRPDRDNIDRYPLRHTWLPTREHRGFSCMGDVDAFGDESLYKPSQLGSATVSPTEVPAGTTAPLCLIYVAGAGGLPEGAKVTFVIRGQVPLGKNMTPLTVAAGPDICTLVPTPFGFTITKGHLNEGDKVTLSAEPFTWTPLACRCEFKVVINYGDDRPEKRLPAPVTVDVLPGPIDRLEATVPCTHVGDEIDVSVTARDTHDNRTALNDLVYIRTDDEKKDLYLSAGIGTARIRASGETGTRISAELASGSYACLSNVSVRTDGQQLYVGDLHCHDFMSEAERYTDEVYRWAIEDRNLDFISVVPQSHGWHDNETWTITKYMNERFLKEGEFVPFLGFEWQHTGYGDKIVHFLGGDQPYLPVDDPRYSSAPKLYEALRKSDALVISHHPCYPRGSWRSNTDFDAVETDVERLAELWSMHGSSEGYDLSDRPFEKVEPRSLVMAALKRGVRLGFTGGSDTHSGRPGGSMKEPGRFWGGLTAVWADSLTRRGLFRALYERRTYALTKARIVLRMTVNNAPMGAEIPAADKANIRIDAWAPDSIAKVELVKNTELLREYRPAKDECHIEAEDDTDGAAFYHCRVTLDDGNLAVCSPVWVGVVLTTDHTEYTE